MAMQFQIWFAMISNLSITEYNILECLKHINETEQNLISNGLP